MSCVFDITVGLGAEMNPSGLDSKHEIKRRRDWIQSKDDERAVKASSSAERSERWEKGSPHTEPQGGW